MTTSDPLLQPFRLKNLELRNRIIITSHEPAYTEDGMPKARYRAYHVERAKAGIAMTMTAGSAVVSRDSPPAFGNILVWKDEVVGWMKQLADECHDHGAAVMIQLTHLGRRTRWDQDDWLPVVSSTHDREPAHRAFPKKLEEWDVKRIIKAYADAAERMKEAGLDGVELQAYGHLLDQSWSPLTNTMDPPYGGSFENRIRFALELIQAVRDRVGPDMVIGIRNAADETVPGGVDQAEGIAMARRFIATGNIDFLNIVRGHVETDAGLTDMIPIQGMRNAAHLDFAGEIRAATNNFPTFHAGKIPDVATARHAIAAGKLDMVGMTRAHLADPHILKKIIAGQEDRIRPCVGANYCLDRIYQGGMALCIHNPSTGRELEMPHEITPAGQRRRVVVIGAGPAGLEAARVAAERGHDVIVHEAANDPGGQIRLTARSGRRREMISIIDWRHEECERLGVTFKFSSYADADAVLEEKPDVVVVATGGLPRTDILEEGNELVVSTWDILSGDVKPGSNVLVYDDAGDHAGMQAAEVIATSGARLEIMTRDRTFAPEVMGMNLVPYMRTLQKLDTTFTVTWRLIAAHRRGDQIMARIGTDYDDTVKERVFDQIVVNNGTLPLDELYFDLIPHSTNGGEVDYEALVAGQAQTVASNPQGRFALYRIGDAVSARNTHAAIYDGLRLARAI